MDTVGSERHVRLLIGDLLFLDGQPADSALPRRLAAVQSELIAPHKQSKSAAQCQLSLRPKSLSPPSQCKRVLGMLPTLPHPADGLLLMPASGEVGRRGRVVSARCEPLAGGTRVRVDTQRELDHRGGSVVCALDHICARAAFINARACCEC